MNPCNTCGKLNAGKSNFCRFCGTKFTFQQTAANNPYDYAPPRPYSWKTDEFQTPNETRQTAPANRSQPFDSPPQNLSPNFGAQFLAQQQQPQIARAFRC